MREEIWKNSWSNYHRIFPKLHHQSTDPGSVGSIRWDGCQNTTPGSIVFTSQKIRQRIIARLILSPYQSGGKEGEGGAGCLREERNNQIRILYLVREMGCSEYIGKKPVTWWRKDAENEWVEMKALVLCPQGVCVYVYTHECGCACMCVHMNVCTHMYVCKCVIVCLSICAYTCVTVQM